MKPIDFVIYEEEYNTPAGVIAEAMKLKLRIHSSCKDWEILSYYIGEDGHFHLDIQPKKRRK